MRKIGLRTSFILALFAVSTLFAPPSRAQSEEPPSPSEPVRRAMSPSQFAASFVVKVVNRVALTLGPQIGGGHGTGFIVAYEDRLDAATGQTRKIGIVFTNKHVIEKDAPFFVQELKLEFRATGLVPHSVNARLTYVSGINDFAVLEFDVGDLGNFASDYGAALLPPPGSPYRAYPPPADVIQGRRALAIGNPLAGANITTYGEVTGLWTPPGGPTYLQTQAPINPGNSGGPLLDAETGVVIGMTTAKMNGHDNTGFAIPIGVVMGEYSDARANPSLGDEREILARFGIYPAPMLDVFSNGTISLRRQIAEASPGFFERAEYPLVVHDADRSSGLQAGDVIVLIEGEPPTGLYDLRRAMQYASSDSLRFRVIRGGRAADIAVHIDHSRMQQLRRELDFVAFSGMFFIQTTPLDAWRVVDGLSAVRLRVLYPSAALSTGAFQHPAPESVIVGVDFGGEVYVIRNLWDLKRALNENAGQRFARLHAIEPLVAQENGRPRVVNDAMGAAIMTNRTKTFIVPVTELLTPLNLRMSEMLRRMSLDPARIETIDWRQYVRSRPTEFIGSARTRAPALEAAPSCSAFSAAAD